MYEYVLLSFNHYNILKIYIMVSEIADSIHDTRKITIRVLGKAKGISSTLS
jgi:hypothetical protein